MTRRPTTTTPRQKIGQTTLFTFNHFKWVKNKAINRFGVIFFAEHEKILTKHITV